MPSKLTIGKKFALTGTFLIGMSILLGASALIGIGKMQNVLTSVTNGSLAGVSNSGRVESAILEIRGDIWRHIDSPEGSVKAELEQQIQGLKDQANRDLAELDKEVSTDEERVLEGKIRPGMDRYWAAWNDVAGLSNASKHQAAYQKYMAEGAPAFDAVKDAVRAEVEYHCSHAMRDSADARRQSGSATSLIWALLIFSVLAGAGMLLAITRGTNAELLRAVSELSAGAEQVASAAVQIASSSQSLAQGSSEQAASLEETSASSEQINSVAHKNTESTRSAADLVGQVQQKFADTTHALDGTVAAMQELNASSEKISKIIKVIDEIAFQTNILALNAAVEAARAGEAGMGFAVVADEVRNLAQRSAQAARDTATLIEESIAKSRDGKSKVDHVAAAIREIAQDSTKIQVLVDEVNVASQEQSRGIDQVAKAVLQMEQVTQRAAASAEESASASTQLGAQAKTMQGIVEQLEAMVRGSDAVQTAGSSTRVLAAVDVPAKNRSSFSPGNPPGVPLRRARGRVVTP